MDAKMAYRETAVQGASQVGLVVLLYEQIIEDLRVAVEALRNHQIELRTRRINHAILVLGHLQSTLNKEQGGKVAHDLDHYYNLLRAKLTEAQARASQQILQAQIADLLSLCEAWIQVDHAENPHNRTNPLEPSSDQASSAKWSS